jgi:8-oxo-dGTP diphosphatase
MGKKHIETIARGVCVEEGMLLVCRTQGSHIVYLPGGHIEFQESARVALEREIAEELGRNGRTGRFLGAIEHTFLQKGARHSEINLVFELTIDALRAGIPPASRERHIDFLWVPLDRLDQSDLEPEVLRDMLPDWIESREIVNRMITSGGPWDGDAS